MPIFLGGERAGTPDIMLNNKIRVMLLDDHEVVRAGLIAFLSQADDIEVIGSFGRVAELMAAMRQASPNVVLLDYSLGKHEVDGINLVQSLRARFPDCALLVVSSIDMPAVLALLRKAGVAGFVGKAQAMDSLLKAIRLVSYGASFWPEEAIDEPAVDSEEEDGLAALLRLLSPREQEVIRCLLDGMTVGQIAAKFARSVKTISTQKQSAMQKLGVQSDIDLFRLNARLHQDGKPA